MIPESNSYSNWPKGGNGRRQEERRGAGTVGRKVKEDGNYDLWSCGVNVVMWGLLGYSDGRFDNVFLQACRINPNCWLLLHSSWTIKVLLNPPSLPHPYSHSFESSKFKLQPGEQQSQLFLSIQPTTSNSPSCILEQWLHDPLQLLAGMIIYQ